jgi:hypothetical protein
MPAVTVLARALAVVFAVQVITTTYPVDFTIPLPCGVTPQDTMSWKGPLVVSAPADGSTTGVTADATKVTVRTGSGAVYALRDATVKLDASGLGTFTFTLALIIPPDVVRESRAEARGDRLVAAKLKAEARAHRLAAREKQLAARELMRQARLAHDPTVPDGLLAAARTLEADAAALIKQSTDLRAQARRDRETAHKLMREAADKEAAAKRLEKPVVVNGEAHVSGGQLVVKLGPLPSPCP